MLLPWKIYGFITIVRMFVTKCKPLTHTKHSYQPLSVSMECLPAVKSEVF